MNLILPAKLQFEKIIPIYPLLDITVLQSFNASNLLPTDRYLCLLCFIASFAPEKDPIIQQKTERKKMGIPKQD